MCVAMQVEETLKPKAAQQNGEAWTWGSLIASIKPKEPFPNTARLTAYALYDGTQLNDDGAQAMPRWLTGFHACMSNSDHAPCMQRCRMVNISEHPMHSWVVHNEVADLADWMHSFEVEKAGVVLGLCQQP